jgi:hypothetical protein
MKAHTHNHHNAMEATESHDRQSKPHAFRANIFQPSNPSRVSTDPETTSKSTHLHGLHHRHHRHHHSRHGKDVVQSATQLHPPTSFGDLLKQASRSGGSSPRRRIRESSVPHDQEEEDPKNPPPKPVQQEDIARERERVRAREEYVV